ncbi:MAG: hypothetical protein ACYCOO_08935 [Chitinophagaceae bacterium]
MANFIVLFCSLLKVVFFKIILPGWYIVCMDTQTVEGDYLAAGETKLDKPQDAHEAGNIRRAGSNVSLQRQGPEFNSGASHMNQAFPKFHFIQLGLSSIWRRFFYFKNS